MPSIRHSLKYFLSYSFLHNIYLNLTGKQIVISLFFTYNGDLASPFLHSPEARMHQFNYTHQYLSSLASLLLVTFRTSTIYLFTHQTHTIQQHFLIPLLKSNLTHDPYFSEVGITSYFMERGFTSVNNLISVHLAHEHFFVHYLLLSFHSKTCLCFCPLPIHLPVLCSAIQELCSISYLSFTFFFLFQGLLLRKLVFPLP